MQQKVNHQGVRVQASIRLTDGSILNGTVNCGITGRIETVLNAQDSFIEFTSRTGHQRYISRHQIASVEPLDAVRDPHLPEVKEDDEPYMVLGLRHGSSPDAIRHAFERLSQAYAGEKWADKDVPPEITKYAADKLRQINAAYTLLRGQQAAAAPEPVQQPARPQGPLFGQSAAPQAPRRVVDTPPIAPERPAMPVETLQAPATATPPAPAAPPPAQPAMTEAAPASPAPAQSQPAPERPSFAERRPPEQAHAGVQAGQPGDTGERRAPERPLAQYINR